MSFVAGRHLTNLALHFGPDRAVSGTWLQTLGGLRLLGARLILVEGHIQSSPEQVTHLVAERLFDRSVDLVSLANDALARRHPLPAGPALIEPLNDDPREHPDSPAERIRHPRNVRILPRSRDFH